MRKAKNAATEPATPRRLYEWFWITPCGQYVVTRFHAETEQDAWREACWFPNQLASETDQKIKEYQKDGFTMSLLPPKPKPKQVMVVDGLHLLDGR